MHSIEIKPLIQQLAHIYEAMVKAEADHREWLDRVHPHFAESARNLIHYLALRTFDLRDIQWQLSSLGLSSIGHSERYSLVNLRNILHVLYLLDGRPASELTSGGLTFTLDYPKSKKQLERNTNLIFGQELFPGQTRIMVTLPSEAADRPELVQELIAAGMNIARINCSHDGPESWQRMIQHVREASKNSPHHCLIYLEGPKLRTGFIPHRISKKGNEKRGYILLRKGDYLDLVADPAAVTVPDFDKAGKLIHPGAVAVTLPSIFDDIKSGESIWFDDGKMGGVIESVASTRATIRITSASDSGEKLYAEKGINLPDSRLSLPALSQEDIHNLNIIAAQADMVGYSFVRRPEEVAQLQAELKQLGREDIGIILKIETRETFDNLPQLLLTAMRSPHVGVMIARGDLAVELGFLRIAEVQEQIMWLCEAAHIPAIWATQILETLAKTGRATRAEISDAVLSVRAEAAMLNKGPYIVEAVKTLRDIDSRMAPHQLKKKSALRPLNVARIFIHPDTKILAT